MSTGLEGFRILAKTFYKINKYNRLIAFADVNSAHAVLLDSDITDLRMI